MAVSMIGNSIGTYSAPPPSTIYGVPGTTSTANNASVLSGALSLLGIGGASTAVNGSNGASGMIGNLNAPATAADIQQMQAGGSAPNRTLGQVQQGVSVASMANRAAGGSASLGAGLGVLGGGLGVINGIQQGGVSGYGSAVVGGLRAGSGIASLAGDSGLAGTLGAAAGYVAAPLAVYNAVSNWKSGSTGSDALNGAEAGAAVGSIIPGIGTVIGAVIGGVVGAVSSAFGGGKESTESTNMESINSQLAKASPAQQQSAGSSMSASQAVQYINGTLNAHIDTAGHSTSMQQVFGKNNVAGVMSQMTQQINNAISSGKVSKGATAQDIYNSVVTPWLKSKGVTVTGSAVDKNGNNEGNATQGALIGLISDWQSGSFTSNTPVGVDGQTIDIGSYGGSNAVNSPVTSGSPVLPGVGARVPASRKA